MIQKGKDYKELIYVASLQDKEKFNPEEYYSYEVYLSFGVTSGLKRDGGIKLNCHDYDGLIKMAQDSIFKALGVDDSQITDATIKKRFDGNYVIARVYGLRKV